MKKIFRGIVRRDWTGTEHYYLHTTDRAMDSTVMFRDFKDKNVKITIQDTEEEYVVERKLVLTSAN